MTVLLPRTFKATHQTAGLPGYPAIDIFGPPGSPVRLNVWGHVRRLSGHPCSQGGTAHGPYGRSVYVKSADGDRYLTHLDRVFVKVGDPIAPTIVIGTVCDSAVSHLPGTSHVHYGFHRFAPATLFDVIGPLGGSIARNQSAAQVAKGIALWVRRHGLVSIQAHDDFTDT